MIDRLSNPPPKNVLSIDLASTRYRDFGISMLREGSHQVEILQPADLNLSGKPELANLVENVAAFCLQEHIQVLLLDGPQGWKAPRTGIEHMRLCERVFNTPGKTGRVGHVKPANYLRYIALSISLFHSLRVDHGWSLLRDTWFKFPERRWVVESYPSKAWETLGLRRLPSKARATKAQVQSWARQLEQVTGLQLPEQLSHDELQACIVLTAGRALVQGNQEGILICGMNPRITRKGDVLEGWIAVPTHVG